ncbi:MAG: hypothetical protein PHU21_09750, partial [Elusimicrobia bacterium]|nr:hypothetical protein [Elusimicrobiota bacterium]
VFHHLKVLAGLCAPGVRLSYWITRTGPEAGFVLEQGPSLLAVAATLSDRPGYADCAGLEAFLKAHPGACGVLVHTGPDTLRLRPKIAALPWTALA